MTITKISITTCNNITSFGTPATLPISPLQLAPTIFKTHIVDGHTRRAAVAFASKSGGFSLNAFLKKCETCGGKGAIECQGCKGTGRNKKNGNIFERWKCFDCQGFGLRGCPTCGQGGLTPEQRGER